jgi:membrane associated rhomboid family serine protease
MFNLTPVVKNLLIINIAVFIGALLLDAHKDVVQNFALYYIGSDNFRAWQFVTYMFLHADFRHLFGNMLGLLIFGPWLEQVWGSKRFLQYYLITGVGAAVLFMGVEFLEIRPMQQEVKAFLLEPSPERYEFLVIEHFEGYYPQVNSRIRAYAQDPDNAALERQAVVDVQELYGFTINIPMLGASGAIFGILLAAGLLFPERRLFLLFPPIPVKARILVLFYGGYEIYALLQRTPNDQVAHMAHLGGMLVGFILLVMWGESRTRYQ